MSTFNRTIALLAVTFCGLLAAGQAGAETKIGYVNFQKLLEEAPQTKSAMQALENEFGPRRRELMTMQTDLKAKEDKLAKESAVMAESDRANAEKTFRDQQREFSRKAGEFQDDASTRKNEELGKVQRFLFGEIQTYANAQGYDLVLGDGVLFAKAPLDITAAVLAQLQTKPTTLPASPPKTQTPPGSAPKPTGSPK
jgi:outer membrane protein